MSPRQLGDLIDLHGPALVLYARQCCSVPEDVVQDAFVRLIGQRHAPDDPVAWLYRVVRNGAFDSAKTERRRQRLEKGTQLFSRRKELRPLFQVLVTSA
jgi:RNA polymerase sigma-70 factor (ECF subfamily)